MMMGGPGGVGPGMGDFGEGKTVKGVPLSGEIIVDRDTTLADGNKIHNESQSKVIAMPKGECGASWAWTWPCPRPEESSTT